MTNNIAHWTEPTGAIVPKDAHQVGSIAEVATALSERDKKQIVTAFQADAYEMMAGYVLNKAMSQLKRQLASLGMEFVGEMLGRADIGEDSIPTTAVSDFEAINLARELGVINSTDAKRLTQHLELLAHFDSLPVQDAEFEEMTREDALSFLRTCVNTVLGRGENFAPVEFVAFRQALESRTFKNDDPEISTLQAAPYFFKKTTLSILFSNMKSRAGAQFEHSLGNIVVILPALWGQLRDNEKWSAGQVYAEVVSAGNSAAVVAMKKALTEIGGFDFVPESLRSHTFSAAASAVIAAHTEMNNFYNEPPAISALARLGSTIPWPAFPISMSAILAVKLGNAYGVSNAAQHYADSLLTRLTANQWEYYLNQCLSSDQMILSKLAWYTKPRHRWAELAGQYGFAALNIKVDRVGKLVAAAAPMNEVAVASAADWLLKRVSL